VIYLRITRQITDVTGIDFEVKGGGKNAFVRYWHEMEEDGEGQMHSVEHHEKMKKKKKFLGYKTTLTDCLPGSELEGDYRIAYKFTLPDHIPSSLMYKNKKSREAPQAKVKYFVKAKIISANEDMCMGHKAVLAVREKPEALQTNTTIKETSEIKTWGCCAQGTSSMEA